MRYVSLAFVLACGLGLAACGDEEPADVTAVDPGGDGAANPADEVREQMTVEELVLTDEVMEQYVAIATEIKRLREEGQADLLKALERHGWSAERWNAIVREVSSHRSPQVSPAAREKMESNIAMLEKQIESMKAKPGTEAAVKRLSGTRDALQRALDDLPGGDSLAAKNQAVIERWKAKIDAIGQ